MATKIGTKTHGAPVAGFDMEFEWYEEWVPLFDKQIELIRLQIERARADGDMVVYLSCPISNRGGGYHRTNVTISEYVAARINERWGSRVWVLNPSQFQMESKSGRSQIEEHALALNIDLSTLERPRGGDYMRMWAKVLLEDLRGQYAMGDMFDAYYFLGPADTHAFFARETGARTVTSAVEDYLARQIGINSEYREHVEGARDPQKQRRNYVRFYSLRAGAEYSKGCHDEWNIWHLANKARLETIGGPGIGETIAGYFDGRAISPGSAMTPAYRGYQFVQYPPAEVTRRS